MRRVKRKRKKARGRFFTSSIDASGAERDFEGGGGGSSFLGFQLLDRLLLGWGRHGHVVGLRGWKEHLSILHRHGETEVESTTDQRKYNRRGTVQHTGY